MACKRWLFLCCAVLLGTVGKAQTAPGKYWVQFTDRANTPFSINQPQDYLSPAAIERRTQQNIPIAINDLPVNPHYIDSVLAQGAVDLVHRSKWFNAITINTVDTPALDSIRNLPFVLQVKSAKSYKRQQDEIEKKTEQVPYAKYNHLSNAWQNYYGPSYRQIQLHNGHLLHAAGFRGEGMRIAVMDGGFRHVDQLPVFEDLRSENRIKDVWSFVHLNPYVYGHSNHGMYVLSCMAAEWEGQLVGTAPDAEYFLYETENVGLEARSEEDNWVAAAEYADSIGVQIFNTSLGYSEFDDSTQNYTYADMDGNTSRIAIAADIAASKGILVVTSAGNSGTSPWYHITTPADADSSLTVGAVDTFGVYKPFSSKGPSADGRVKPDVAAMGFRAYLAGADSSVIRASGTSFSSPIMCGLAACLWQAHPEKTNMEIVEAIRQSGHQYATPDSFVGYGIPDLYKAHLMLSGKTAGEAAIDQLEVYPNPSGEDVFHLNFYNGDNEEVVIALYDMMGRKLSEIMHSGLPRNEHVVVRFDATTQGLKPLETGTYVVEVSGGGVQRSLVWVRY